MPINANEKVIDANLFSPISRASERCSLLEWLINSFSGSFFVIKEQYERSPCQRYPHFCELLEEKINFSDEEAMDFFHKNCECIDRIADDSWDIRTAYYGIVSGATVLSGDSGLLMLCQEVNVPHLCFKAIVYFLNKNEQIFELNGDGFQFDLLFDPNEENPFISYLKNKNCVKCCGEECEAAKNGIKQISM